MHKHLTRRQKKKTVDVMAYVVGIGGNVAVIPQIIKAWSDKAPGMAVLTWILFICIGVIWLAYAVMHKLKPLVVTEIIAISCNVLVVAGWVVHNVINK